MSPKVRFTRERVASFLTRLQALAIKSYETNEDFDFRRSVISVLDDFQNYMKLTGKPYLQQLCIEDVVAAADVHAPAVGTESPIGDADCSNYEVLDSYCSQW